MSGKKVQTADDFVVKGNSLFVDEQFDDALEAYTNAIELEDDHFEAFLKRSAAHYSLKNYAGTDRDYLLRRQSYCTLVVEAL